jgi:hypothetical protein
LRLFHFVDRTGTWSVYQIKLKHGPSNKILADVTKPISLPLDDLEMDNSTKSQTALVADHNTVAMTMLKDNYVAIVTSSKQTSKESGFFLVGVCCRSNFLTLCVAEHVLSIWDVRYGTLQTSKRIKNDSASHKSKDIKGSDNHIMYKVRMAVISMCRPYSNIVTNAFL